MRHHFVVCNTGVRCRQLAREFFDDESKAVLQALTDAINGIRPGAWLRVALKTIDPQCDRIVVDSIRSSEDIALVRTLGYVVWRITAPLEVRTMRLRGRGQAFDPGRDDLHESEVALDDFAAEFEIENTGDLAQLYETVEKKLSQGT